MEPVADGSLADRHLTGNLLAGQPLLAEVRVYWLLGISVLLSGKKLLKRKVSPSLHWGDGKENERIQPSSTLHFRTDIPSSQRRTLHGYEVMNMIRKGQMYGVDKGDILSQLTFIAGLFGVAS